MTKEKNKIRKHFFADRLPILTSILMGGLAMVFVQQGPSLFELPFASMHLSFDWIIGIIGLAVFTCLVLLLYKWWFRPEFSGMIPGDLAEAFILSSPVLLYWIIGTLYGYFFEKDLMTFRMSGQILETSIMAGAAEELCFRGIMISTLLRVWRKKDAFVKAALVSSLAFGLTHSLNIMNGANPVRTGSQVLSSFFLGIFFSAVFIRFGSIIPPMAIHAVHDIIALATAVDVSESGVIQGGFSFGVIIDLVLCILMGLYGLYLLRRSKNDDLHRIWDDKWAGDFYKL